MHQLNVDIYVYIHVKDIYKYTSKNILSKIMYFITLRHDLLHIYCTF